MSTYGVTTQGFVAKPLAVIKGELDAAFKAGPLGESAGTEPDGSIPGQSLAGQIVAIMADGLAAQWDLQQAVYSSADPGQASDAAQDAVCSITGTVRDPSVQSTVTASCTGDPGTILNLGRAAKVEGTGVKFLSLAGDPGDANAPASTLVAVPAWAVLTAYAVGDRVTRLARVYHCITAGVSAAAGGPTGTGADIVDGTVHWRYLGEGTAAVDVPFEADTAGPFGALSGKLNQIATPVSGWKTVTNLLDAKVGAYLEGNTSLRLRRDAELHAEGLAAVDAIRHRVLRVGDGTVDAVTACTVFYNDGDAVSGDGLPPHSVEVLALGGLDQAIADAIWASVGAGIHTHGTITKTVTDSQGNTQTVRFSRPTAIPIWIIANVINDSTPGVFPSNGSALIKGALKTFGDTYSIGRDVRASALAAAIFDGPSAATPGSTPVPGVLDAVCLIGVAPAPGTSNPITITSRQIATFDSANISVVLTGATP